MLLLFRVSANVKCERARIRNFRQTFSVSVTKKFVREPFSVSLLSDNEKFFA